MYGYHRSYRGDPHWITLKWVGKCRKCGASLQAGSRAYRYKTGDLYGDSCGCGHQAESEFTSVACDEDVYNGCGNPW